MDLLVTYLRSLFGLQRAHTIFGAEKLYEAVGLLDRDLRKVAVGVEDVEDVAFGDLFGTKIS